MKRAIGKNTLGSGKKMEVALKNYERSTHDLSRIWRSTMACGTLVPFLKEVGLTGDTFDINLETHVLTHPTIGPLFGSFKLQLDVFTADIRLYQGRLHNNALNIGMNMANIKLPLLVMDTEPIDWNKPVSNQQVNPSSILKYIGISGTGSNGALGNQRYFNAVPYLMYAEIYKNYYANKQETNGVIIHNTDVVKNITLVTIQTGAGTPSTVPTPRGSLSWVFTDNDTLSITYNDVPPLKEDVMLLLSNGTGNPVKLVNIEEIFATITSPAPSPGIETMYCTDVKEEWVGWMLENWQYRSVEDETKPQLYKFPLANIDTMREDILTATKTATPFYVNTGSIEPYNLPLLMSGSIWSRTVSQEGLFIKTYQSDIFNNWIKTEWISGSNSINDITKIDTSGGNFTIDTLIIKRKVYNMLNAIAVSGGSYDDWLDINWSEERYSKPESPVYHGGLSKEIVFQEIISNSATTAEGGQPLGTLAGRGVLSKKHKGGYVRIKCNEPCYVMGIVSITPRIDYSQGNDWDMSLTNMDDFHKPALDGIGFQDRITDQMAWWDTGCTAGGVLTYKSAGKQPAWLNYMTSYNRVFGNFAIEGNQMFMVLNRNYEYNKTTKTISDLTTYIDPSKYNNIFAYTKRDAQNFWVQIGINMEVRRKMSAKIMPQG
jgi:hypothetical protein